MEKIAIKTFLKGFLILSCFFSLLSCDEDIVSYADGGFQQVADPLLRVDNSVVSFQAGTASYSYAMELVNGLKSIETVNIYKIYTDAALQASSEKVLFETVQITDAVKQRYESTFTYDDLKAGLTVQGNALPASDGDLAVGSNWVFSFEGITTTGEVIGFSAKINVGVLSPYAGIYKVIDADYYRIGVLGADWTGTEIFIGSVDENTFAHNDYWGPFAWTGASFNFDINLTTNAITVPVITSSGLFSGNRPLNCTDDAAAFVNVPCTGSNVLTVNNATGKHRIKLTYGYFTDGSGAREFYEELEKVVD